MGFKIKNSLTGEFEKLPILTLKGEKGETGGVEEYNKVDYMGNKYETLKQANDANVEYAVKTAIGEFNYLDYDGQHITTTDSIEGQSKSAILKGQTLVNIHKPNTPRLGAAEQGWYENLTRASGEISFDVLSTPAGWRYIDAGYLNYQMLKPNTKYLVVFESSQNISSIHFMCGDGLHGLAPSTAPVQNSKAIITTNSQIVADEQILYVNFYAEPNTKVSFKNPMIIEYQEGMENWDIPYFEGMTSVKAPVLKSVGKNLAKAYINNGTLETIENGYVKVIKDSNTIQDIDYTDVMEYIPIKPNTYYSCSWQLVSGSIQTEGSVSACFAFCDKNKEVIKWVSGANQLSPENAYYVKRVRLHWGNKEATLKNFKFTMMLEEGQTITEFEPYKSNILTANEDVVLRGIGDMKDTLDISTREKVERIGEVVLDGSENWLPHTSGYYFTQIDGVILQSANPNKVCVLSDKYNGKLQQNVANLGEDGIAVQWSNSQLIIRDSTVSNVDELKNKLTNSPTTVNYIMSNETVKTVDLSDNHVYSYDNTTHYDCSSAEGSLVPTLSVKVPTDVQATIAQQRETIQTLNSENERLNQIQEALKASMLDSQVQLMNLSWNTDFEVFTLRESIAPKDFLLASRTGSNIDKFSQAKFIIENDCPDLEKLNSQIEYYFSKDVFSQEQFEELTDLISIVKGENGCEY